MTKRPIPTAVVLVVADVLGNHYYSHNRLNVLFTEAGAPGEPPPGNCTEKCRAWLKIADVDESVDAYQVLGRVLENFLDYDHEYNPQAAKGRERILGVLKDNGLSYQNGQIFGGSVGAPARSLDSILRDRNMPVIELEFDRAIKSAEQDPGAAVTAACALVEAFCKVYLQDEGKALPSKQDVKSLWHAVREDLGLSPKLLADEDLKSILTGLGAVVSGLGALRTHTGSAHGHGRDRYRVEPRHARLAVHSAHSLVIFLLETWDARRSKARGSEPEGALTT